jgi:hypothetical protein
MALSIEDRLAIGEVIRRHGHLIDVGELDSAVNRWSASRRFARPR